MDVSSILAADAGPAWSLVLLPADSHGYPKPRTPELHFLVSAQELWEWRTIPSPTVSESKEKAFWPVENLDMAEVLLVCCSGPAEEGSWMEIRP